MNSADFHDKHLDPPAWPTHWECDLCHERFDGGDLTRIGDSWFCNECMEGVNLHPDEDEAA